MFTISSKISKTIKMQGIVFIYRVEDIKNAGKKRRERKEINEMEGRHPGKIRHCAKRKGGPPQAVPLLLIAAGVWAAKETIAPFCPPDAGETPSAAPG